MRDLLAGDVIHLAARVARLADHLRGTRPYWQARRRELLAMIKDLKCPHVFFTASAADVQWKDLHRFMPRTVSADTTEQERIRIFSANLNENPAIAAYWFQKRWELFFKHVLQKKFKIKDYWWRYEWQFRGSSHVHAFFWFEDAPAVESLNLEDPESVTAFIEFWDPLVSAWNPSQNAPKATVHPSARDLFEMNFTLRNLAQLLNRVQRHTTCTPSYCLRRPKGAPQDAPLVCRFKYPQECSDTTTIKPDDNKKPKIFPKRNDPLLNLHNVTQILGWQANVDFSPLTSMHAVLNCIAKYCSKTEKKSEDYHQIFNTILTSLEIEDPSRVLYQKLLSNLIVERDWSAQECCHLLLGCPLHQTSQQFRSLNLSWPRLNAIQQLDPLMDDDDLAHTEMSWIDRYERRNIEVNIELADVSLLQTFRRYNFKHEKFGVRPRAKPRVVNVWPAYIPDKSDPAMYENWCRAKLQLHHPYSGNVEVLQKIDGEDIGWAAAYANCVATCHHGHDDDPLANEKDLDDDDGEDEEFEDPDEEEEIEREIRDCHQLANPGPMTQFLQHSRLGKREIDYDYDWHHSYTTFEDIQHRESHLESQKRMVEIVGEIPDVDILNLVDNQRRIFLRVVSHYYYGESSDIEKGSSDPSELACYHKLSSSIFYSSCI